MGNFIFVTRTYSIEQICDSSRLCQLVEDECLAILKKVDVIVQVINRELCANTMLCVYQSSYGEDRDRCSG